MTGVIYVPDVQATADWYATLGFALTETRNADAEIASVQVALGHGSATFEAGPDAGEVDLYVSVEDVEALHRRLAGKVEMAADLHDTEYGMRQFGLLDLNGFRLTFAQPIAGRREPQL